MSGSSLLFRMEKVLEHQHSFAAKNQDELLKLAKDHDAVACRTQFFELRAKITIAERIDVKLKGAFAGLEKTVVAAGRYKAGKWVNVPVRLEIPQGEGGMQGGL